MRPVAADACNVTPRAHGRDTGFPAAILDKHLAEAGEVSRAHVLDRARRAAAVTVRTARSPRTRATYAES